MPQRKWLTSVRGEHVTFTGKAWRTRSELRLQVNQCGGIISSWQVRADTTVLVRGESTDWAYVKYGLKEEKAAQLIRKGRDICLIQDFEFRKLLENGRPARVYDYVAGQPVRWLQPVSQKQFEQTAKIDGPLDREYSV